MLKILPMFSAANVELTDKGAVIQVLDGNENNSSEARRCTVRITADTEGIGPFAIPVTQEGEPEFDSTLAEELDFGTLTSCNYVIVYLTMSE